MTDMVGDWVYLLGYCIEMAYRRSRHRRMSKKAGRASRKGGLKRGGLSRRVKRGGKRVVCYDYPPQGLTCFK
jgi:hypothetical protein